MHKIRKWILFAWITLLLSGVCYLFWHEDLKYSLPTPVPDKYRPVSVGAVVKLENKVKTGYQPVFLHFFNPDCPCSRFNIPHFRSLVKKYGDKIAFGVVVMSEDSKYSAETLRDKFDLDIPVYFDRSIADSCGVYSTPQAVLLDDQRKLYYRGNYNKARYCIDKETNFAQMAIDSMLGGMAFMADKTALKSYGCSLPVCTK